MSKVSSADDKRLRREIANSNERRRMQSINAGFIALRQLLPLSEGEKLSKAAILQLTAKYINVLSQEKSRLLQQNNKLKEQLQQQQASSSCAYAPPSRAGADESGTTDASLQLRKLQPRAVLAPPPVTNVAHEVTVGSDVSSLPLKNQQVAQSSSTVSLAAPSEAAQMNLPLRKRKRTFSLSVEPSVPTSKSDAHAHALLSVNSCPRQPDDDADDADGLSAAPSASTCRTLPADDGLRFVPSAPEASPATPQTGLPYPMANPVVLVSAGAASQPRNALFTSPPFRFDMITSVQPSGGVPLLLSTPTRQRFDSVSFANVNLEPPVPVAPAAQTCESSTSITKKNLETIFEAIRHVEGDDLSLGETPCRQQRQTEAQSPASGASMLVPFGDSQPQTAFLVCLSPAMASASGDYCKSPVQFSMNTVISPVSVAGSAPRYAHAHSHSRGGQPQLTDYEAISSYSSSGSVLSSTYNSVS